MFSTPTRGGFVSRSLRLVWQTFGVGVMSALLLAGTVSTAWAQDDDPNREPTREKVRSALRQIGPKIGVSFKQSQANPFNFSASMSDGLESAESMEIIVMVGRNDILTVRVFPHLSGNRYINVDRAGNSTGLMRKLLANNAGDFFHWGMDDVYDVFAEFTFTLESGFPEESLDVVLRSVALLDKKVGEMGLLIGR
jgi:hypothetical protein